MSLSSNADEQLDTKHPTSPRQRDEFHFPEVHRVNVVPHHAGIWGRGKWSLVTLDAVSDTLCIKDYVRGTGGKSCGSMTCPTTNLSSYLESTMTHTISGNFGQSGSLSYSVMNEEGHSILSYTVNGSMGQGGGYVKFGLYRLAFEGMTTASAVVGDWALGQT
ncbi:hypothetical protein B0H11DRAFT_2223717 [Mycena galericulata]|nr:hypothetical protein B0H11DRAFT_2223717 [Mycena galericulata]